MRSTHKVDVGLEMFLLELKKLTSTRGIVSRNKKTWRFILKYKNMEIQKQR